KTKPQSTQASKIIQRRANIIPKAVEMEKVGRASYINKDEYDDVLNEVNKYYNDEVTPMGNYGKQLYHLEEIGERITTWEKKEGPVVNIVASDTFRSLTEDRREALNDLKTKLPQEKTHVQKEGLDFATREHKTDRTHLLIQVQKGLESKDRRLRNSCEWILT